MQIAGRVAGRLTGKVALITGAGRGIGRATALALSREGARVAVCDQERGWAEESVDAIQAQGGEAVALVADVSRAATVQRAVEATVEQFGALNVIFNNAGVWMGQDGPAPDVPEEVWDRIIDINLKGPFLTCKYAIPHMVCSGGGSIINVASVSAFRAGKDNYDAYAASKGGVVAMTYTMASTWGPKGIRVNAVCPGSIDTPMTAGSYEEPRVNEFWRTRTALGRVGDPSEVAQTVVWLASDDSSYITGAVIMVDGGYMTR